MSIIYTTNTCVLCDRKILPKYRLCTEHFREYGDQLHTEWFMFLLTEQKKQDVIDRLERYNFPYGRSTDIYGSRSDIELLSKRKVGRPATDWRIIDKVLKVYDDSLEEVLDNKVARIKSLRQMARDLNGIIDHCTIRNILNIYRPKKERVLSYG